MLIELTQAQINNVIVIIDNSSFKGKDIEIIVELKKALTTPRGE
jgi:hypothetical protein